QVTDLVKLYPRIVNRQGSSKTTYIALTFDDGPDNRYTPKILDVLKKYKVKATFFVVGTQIKKYPAIFRRMVKEGHEIGTHGYQHLNVSKLPATKINYQLNESNKLIQKMGGPKQTIYRPPYGAIDPTAIERIGKKGYKVVLWTIDSLDWRSLKKTQVIKNVVPKLKKGYIVLQHNAAESKRENLTGSVQALPTIIERGKKQGFRFVTVSQLLKTAPRK
ncbi:MAG TPA: polysaccharide deacetylase family protein, partial [Bacillota bacterium]|nr:polysaccharide deacetylase family protein [Bacillota bacterium]